MGQRTQNFENKFKNLLGANYALMVNSGSSANLLATFASCNPMRKKKFKRGDEAIIQSLCWPTSLWPLVQCGLKIKFVDVNPSTLNVNADDLIKNVSKKTKVILIINVLGIICKDKKDYEILKSLRSHGWSREKKTAIKYPNLDPRYIFINSGFNLRPTDIQAAIGLSQFKKLKKFMKIRINNRNKIIKTLKMHKNWSDQFSFVEVPKKISPSYMVFPIFLNKKFRKKKTDFINFVESKGLETRPIISGSFVKQPSTKLFKLNQKNKKFPGANFVQELGFVIGLHTKNISSSKLKFLSETLLSIDRL